jgi:hypothetical protein
MTCESLALSSPESMRLSTSSNARSSIEMGSMGRVRRVRDVMMA